MCRKTDLLKKGQKAQNAKKQQINKLYFQNIDTNIILSKIFCENLHFKARGQKAYSNLNTDKVVATISCAF